MVVRMLETLAISTLGGVLFFYLHIPLPWLLGSLTSVVLWNVLVVKRPFYWPSQCCYAGLLLVGYGIGRTFTAETGYQILKQFPIMLLITVATALFSLLQGYGTYKKTGVSLSSGMLGSIPGGLSQMAVLCSEISGADITVVTFMQTARQLAVVFVVPFLAMRGLGNDSMIGSTLTTVIDTNNQQHLSLSYLLMLSIVIISSGFLARYLKLPTPFLLGPVLGTAFWVLYGFIAPQPSREWLNVAQIFIGAYTGARIKLSNISNWKKLLPYTVVNVTGLLVFSLITGSLLSYFLNVPLITAFLSTAPGGMAEMGITAMMVHADISVVVAFQLFRLLFLLTVVPPLLKWFVQYNDKKV